MTPSPPVFIVGPPRSGTSLLSQLLSNNDAMFLPMETDVFSTFWKLPLPHHHLGQAFHILIDSITSTGAWRDEQIEASICSRSGELANRLPLPLTHRDVFSLFMDEYTRLKGKTRWGEKTPRHIYRLETMAAAYPQAYFVFIMRNPADMIASYKKAQAASRQEDLYSPIVTALHLKLMLRRSSQFVQRHPALNTYVLRYEDLADTPGQTMQDLCGFLQLRYDESMLKTNYSNSSFAAPAQQAGIRKRRPTGEGAGLRAVEFAVLCRCVGREAHLLGYRLRGYRVSAHEVLLWCLLPFSLLRVVYTKARSSTVSGSMCSFIWDRLR
jgi:hypothetical protein